MNEIKLSKTQQKLKQRIEIAREIYERVYREYLDTPQNQRWKFHLIDRTSAEIQATLVVSDRKAREYIKFIKATRKPLVVQENI